MLTSGRASRRTGSAEPELGVPHAKQPAKEKENVPLIRQTESPHHSLHFIYMPPPLGFC